MIAGLHQTAKALVAFAVYFAAACAHADGVPNAGSRPGVADARVAYFADDQGLTVVSIATAIEQPVSRPISVIAKALVDHIEVHRDIEITRDTGNQPTGHMHDDADAVTSASVSSTGGNSLAKTRYEGTLGAAVEFEVSDVPTRVQPTVRVSSESDYTSYSGRLGVSSEFAERNTTLSLFVGYGHDDTDPIKPPPGETDRWPASHSRVNAGVTLSQVLAPTLLASVGAAGSRQAGTLESPYRRALIRTSLFPEKLPSTRARMTAFVGLAWYVGWETALHLRQGVYLDSWGVAAVIPQLSVVREFGQRGLFSLYYRYYGQSASSFYAPRYETLEALRTSDARLGRLRQHAPGVELRWDVMGRTEDSGALSVTANYELSLLEQLQLDHSITAHILAAGLTGSY